MIRKTLKIPSVLIGALLGLMFTSCSSGKLATTGVVYQSVRTVAGGVNLPDDAKIKVDYYISNSGAIYPKVSNNTDEIMIIDKTSSFFVNTDGKSLAYYDSTVKYNSTTDFASETEGFSVNLGAISNAFGIGGPLGTALGGINVGESSTTGSATTNATYTVDQPKLSLSPHSSDYLKPFDISGVGKGEVFSKSFSVESPKESPIKFSICITYSIDNGETFDKLITDFYVNAQICEPVFKNGRVNDSVRRIYQKKSDAVNERWWLLYFKNNLPNRSNVYDTYVHGSLIDGK